MVVDDVGGDSKEETSETLSPQFWGLESRENWPLRRCRLALPLPNLN